MVPQHPCIVNEAVYEETMKNLLLKKDKNISKSLLFLKMYKKPSFYLMIFILEVILKLALGSPPKVSFFSSQFSC